MAGTFLQDPISSFLAEAIALEEAVKFLSNYLHQVTSPFSLMRAYHNRDLRRPHTENCHQTRPSPVDLELQTLACDALAPTMCLLDDFQIGTSRDMQFSHFLKTAHWNVQMGD